jgi:hypothetical protein
MVSNGQRRSMTAAAHGEFTGFGLVFLKEGPEDG